MRAQALALAVLLTPSFLVRADSHRGAQFIGWTHFDEFSRAADANHSVTLTSPTVRPEIDWSELIISWNTRGQATNGFSFETQVIYPDRRTGWYHLGNWALDSAVALRQSVRNQRDADGTVLTDTLRVNRPGGEVRVRVTLPFGATNALAFLGFAFSDSKAVPPALEPHTNLWNATLTVPERSQADFPEGISSWCSPTALSMILAYWAQKLGRPGLDHSVPEVARSVNDPNWPGTGNWPFNTAFAGSHPDVRAYVARFSDVSELESWIAAGVPVAVSVSYSFLKGEAQPGNGHLVVCAGFTETGDFVANDPGRKKVRQIYTRANFAKAWRASHHTVYLVYPESFRVPTDFYGHWFTP